MPIALHSHFHRQFHLQLHGRRSLRLGMLALLVVIPVLVNAPVHAHGQAISAAPTAAATAVTEPIPKFQIIQMLSATNGWAVATIPDARFDANPDNPSGPVYSGKIGYVLHTQDGGKTWANLTPQTGLGSAEGTSCDCTDNSLAGFFFLDDNHAWVATDDAGLPHNQIFSGIDVLRTSYGGHSWQSAHQGLNGPAALMLSFSDALHGWVLIEGYPKGDGVNQPAVLYQTTDGGASWQLIADDGQSIYGGHQPISPVSTGVTSTYHSGMVFESANSGWMTIGNIPGDGALLHTTDGGKNWYKVNVTANSAAVGALATCSLSGLRRDAPGVLTFLAACMDDSGAQTGFLYQTTNDGKRWQANRLPDNFVAFPGLLQIFMVNSTNGWAVGCDSPANGADPAPCESDAASTFAFYKTADTGKSWTRIGLLPVALRPLGSANMGWAFGQFDFIDDHTGWAIDPTGSLFTTTDAGVTWTALSPQ